MVVVRSLTRAAIVVLIGAGTVLWYACPDRAPTGPLASPPPSARRAAPDLGAAIAVLRRHTDAILDIPGVVGTAVTVLPDGRPGMQILLERSGIPGLPVALDGVPVSQRVTGRLMAFSDPTQRQRPAPSGFSVGHPAITAGTIGARVRDALGRVYILSNNHVQATSNGATIGDAEYQPGPFDGGTAADQIATLTDFQAINFAGGNNTIDAAIALSSTSLLDNATPSDDGYGMPNATIYGDANGDGLFDDRNALLGLNVQKYGRTTRLTHGQITGVNATVTVCYAASGLTCTKSARYVDQFIIEPGTFSGGGDSGSLIVTDDGNLNPVALLFAGSSTVTIANRIDLVLNRFGVSIDGFAPPPPGPLTDLAVTSVSGPSAGVPGTTAGITVTVKNVGNQNVSSFDVTLQDTTEHVTVGTQSVAGLAAGATTTLSFAWTPTVTGDHDLLARQTLADDKAVNDQRFVTIPVKLPVTDVALTARAAPARVTQGDTVPVVVTVQNVGGQDVTTSFDVVLTDGTAGGVTVGTQTIAGLAVGARATRTVNWNTAGVATNGHILIATQQLADNDSTNNARAVAITVNPPPSTDVAVTAVNAPAAVTQGSTAAIGVTVQNVGGLNVSTSFDVVLTDATAGVTLGTQTVTGLAVGATATRTFNWTTATAALGGHTLVATQSLTDDNAANNTRSAVVTVNPQPTDLALTGITAPARVTQGDTARVVVTVQNVGGQDVSTNFDVVLTDGTAGGVTVVTQTIAGLAVSASATRTFNWNTAGVATNGHILIATQKLADNNSTNNSVAIAITVNPPPSTDVAVTGVTAPATVTQGTTAAIGVTVQNVGGLNVSTTFSVVLTDATAGVTIGTQTVTGLAVGATATRTFNWSTTGAALGGHTLVATQSLTDDNAANNTRSVVVTVNTAPADLALASITAPSRVTQGDTAPVVVTVQNVGGQDVTTSFDVVLTDGGTGGVTVGTQTIPGLAAGASATRTFNWKTAGVATNGHILTATQKLADVNSSNNARAIVVTVDPPSVHVGNLDGVADTSGNTGTWSATVRITAHDVKHNLLNGVTVSGSWNGSSSDVGQCSTSDAGGTGTCSVVLSSIPNATRLVSFAVTAMTLSGYVYKSSANHDPDGSSNGFSVTVKRQ